MHIVIKIVLAIALSLFWLYMGLHEGKSISERNLNAKEKKYLEILEGWHMISLVIIAFFIFET